MSHSYCVSMESVLHSHVGGLSRPTGMLANALTPLSLSCFYFFGNLTSPSSKPSRQNIFVRRYLENKAAAEEQRAMDESESSKSSFAVDTPVGNNSESAKRQNLRFGRSQSLDSEESKRANPRVESRKGFFAKFRSGREPRGQTKRGSSAIDSFVEGETQDEEERPPFHSSLQKQASSNKKLEPRAVAIPYSRIKKDRFYDWPPDPTVSRATPIILHHETMGEIDSLTASVPDVPIPDHEDEFPSTLRRRHVPEASIPTSISF